jgi:urea transporter
VNAQHTPSQAESDITQYARALRTCNDRKAVEIEVRWGLYGYNPEIVSTVLACVATGLPLDAAIDEATGAES